jgi:hypothetical protein
MYCVIRKKSSHLNQPFKTNYWSLFFFMGSLGQRKGTYLESHIAASKPASCMRASEKRDDAHTNGRNVVALSRHSWGSSSAALLHA